MPKRAPDSTHVMFTPAMARRLRAAYEHAVQTAADSFVFEGREYLTAYAKYLLEYLTQERLL